MSPASADNQFRTFFYVWLTQSLSMIGTGLTGFALGVWIYQSTGSIAQFTLVAVFGSVPGLLLSPILGTMITRWDRRWAMILSDTMLGLRTVTLALLFTADQLQVWHIYIAVALRSIFEAIQIPAYSAAVTQLVPKRLLSKANGMRQFGGSAANIIAPGIAGVLMPWIDVSGILAIDVVTFLIAVGTLLVVRVPRPEESAEGRKAAKGSFWQRVGYGWRYIRQRDGLFALVLFFAMLNLCLGFSFVLVTPLVLSLPGATTVQLGLVMAIGSAGSLIGGLMMSTWEGPRRKLVNVLIFTPLLGAGLVTIGLQPSVPLIAIGVGFFYFSLPIVNASSQTIWQKKVEPDVQVQVFATRKLIGQFTSPIAFLLAGPVAERIFVPLLVEGGALASSVGTVLGVGDGRGIGLQFLVMGSLLIFASAMAATYQPLRDVEAEEPQAAPAGAA